MEDCQTCFKVSEGTQQKEILSVLRECAAAHYNQALIE